MYVFLRKEFDAMVRELGKRMKKAREEHDISIYEMADACAISHIWLNGIEHDLDSCPASVLISYAEKLGMPIDEIVYGPQGRDPVLTDILDELSGISESRKKTVLGMIRRVKRNWEEAG